MTNWQPISTAPKDGSIILLSDLRQYVASTEVGFYEERESGYNWVILDPGCDEDGFLNGWKDNHTGPTHWAQLPRPPEEWD